MKIQLITTEHGLKSGSLKRLAEGLSHELGYKVWRTSTVRSDRKQLRYGDAVNKLAQYKYFAVNNIPALDFTVDQQRVATWLSEGSYVFGRAILNGSCGQGIIVLPPVQNNTGEVQIPFCPVYTKYKPKKREFRVHMFQDKVVGICEKKRRSDYTGDKGDTKIRNLDHGYIFTQNNTISPDLYSRLSDIAISAGNVSRSNFKGVDVAYNEKKDEVFVIEVNTAPGIEGSNVDKYVKVIAQNV